MRKYLTISEIARRTGLTNRTCQQYLRTFDPFFDVKSCNKVQKYESLSVVILVRIRDLYNNAKDIDQINSTLINEFPKINSDFEEQGTKIHQLPSFATGNTLLENGQHLENRSDVMNRQNSLCGGKAKSEENVKKKSFKGLLERFFE